MITTTEPIEAAPINLKHFEVRSKGKQNKDNKKQVII